MQKLVFHKDLEDGRWFKMTIEDQMGNIGSEVYRALNWHKKHEPVHFRQAFDRALELFDITRHDPRWNSNRKREIGRAREVFCDFFFGGNQYHSTPESLDKYFLWFAMVANSERRRSAVAGKDSSILR